MTNNSTDRPEQVIDESASLNRKTVHGPSRQRNVLIIASVVVVAIFAIFVLLLWSYRRDTKQPANAGAEATKEAETKEADKSKEVILSPEALKTAGIEIAGVTQRPAVAFAYRHRGSRNQSTTDPTSNAACQWPRRACECRAWRSSKDRHGSRDNCQPGNRGDARQAPRSANQTTIGATQSSAGTTCRESCRRPLS